MRSFRSMLAVYRVSRRNAARLAPQLTVVAFGRLAAEDAGFAEVVDVFAVVGVVAVGAVVVAVEMQVLVELEPHEEERD